jgi:hypothetical protein
VIELGENGIEGLVSEQPLRFIKMKSHAHIVRLNVAILKQCKTYAKHMYLQIVPIVPIDANRVWDFGTVSCREVYSSAC